MAEMRTDRILLGRWRGSAGLTVIALAAAAALPYSGSAQSGPKGTARYLTPRTVSSECRTDVSRLAACAVIRRFFRALNSRRFETACALLGERLRGENRGLGCPRFLSAGYPEQMPWGIVGARHAGSGVAVLVALGQSELGHVRMRLHRAHVDSERGRLRILETHLVR
jgi:hypothetical protein